MKKILSLIMLLALFFMRGSAWAAQKNNAGAVDDLLNFDYMDDGKNPAGSQVYDPLEPLNRVFFTFNDKLYFWVEKPVVEGYSAVIPSDLRKCFSNFFDNISSPITFLNDVLQGRFSDAGTVVSRFVINSTLGVFGFGDTAKDAFNITTKSADFGQTLGVWGLGEGVYICWPVFGPSNMRDTVGLAADLSTHPTNFMDLTTTERIGYFGTNRINSDSLHPIYEELVKYSFDPYVAARQAFHEYRQAKIDRYRNTKPPKNK